jgi:hypothetical protein
VIAHVLFWELLAVKMGNTASATADELVIQVDGGSENINK